MEDHTVRTGSDDRRKPNPLSSQDPEHILQGGFRLVLGHPRLSHPPHFPVGFHCDPGRRSQALELILVLHQPQTTQDRVQAPGLGGALGEEGIQGLNIPAIPQGQVEHPNWSGPP